MNQQAPIEAVHSTLARYGYTDYKIIPHYNREDYIGLSVHIDNRIVLISTTEPMKARTQLLKWLSTI